MAFPIARVSVAEMTFILAHVLNVAFVALYPAYKRDWKKPEQVMGCRICTSLFVGREMWDVVPVMKEHVLHLLLWQWRAPKPEGEGNLPAAFGPVQYVT